MIYFAERLFIQKSNRQRQLSFDVYLFTFPRRRLCLQCKQWNPLSWPNIGQGPPSRSHNGSLFRKIGPSQTLDFSSTDTSSLYWPVSELKQFVWGNFTLRVKLGPGRAAPLFCEINSNTNFVWAREFTWKETINLAEMIFKCQKCYRHSCKIYEVEMYANDKDIRTQVRV